MSKEEEIKEKYENQLWKLQEEIEVLTSQCTQLLQERASFIQQIQQDQERQDKERQDKERDIYKYEHDRYKQEHDRAER